MSNLETSPVEIDCATAQVTGVEVLHPRDVPLGGPRAIRVRRTLPQRQRSLIGAWCFADHYGPHDVRQSAGMVVPPHPHTGLQTVSWLFSGEIEHRDSAGVHALVRPGELNLMTAGAGICHSEVSVNRDEAPVLHGAQLWVALADADLNTGRDFTHYVPEPVSLRGGVARVFLGQLDAGRSPVQTFTPLLGAQLDLDPGADVTLDVDPAFEHGVLCDQGTLSIHRKGLGIGDVGYQGPGSSSLRLHNDGDQPARALLLGGTPFTELLVMWWNFVGRSHDEIVGYRQLWEDGDQRFGDVPGYRGSPARLPAPPLPTTTLRPRPPVNRKEPT
ncbi:pirin family protein [Mycobacterium kyorinense]|uniref:Pirin n=1 Tax=Mycobacterium kyorinense TaxID=487514 RepID=A0A1X1XS91_9MYCO|nr:pirin family protein [Mycobacterium kyorinense]ORW01727.1 pirin [Mycobacterium kyorinense]